MHPYLDPRSEKPSEDMGEKKLLDTDSLLNEYLSLVLLELP